MKNLYTLALVLLCAFIGNAQIINFPDAAFKAKLLEADATNSIASTQTPVYDAINYLWSVSSYNKIDTNNDGEIQVSEALAIKYLDVSGPAYNILGTITNMTGVESFVNLILLNCNYNVISNLNVSGFINLQALYCAFNQMPSFSVSGLTNLRSLNCSNNYLTSLNVSGLANLQTFGCNFNQLNSLNVSGLNNLKLISCINNLLPSVDLSGLNNLEFLDFTYNQITSIDASSLTNLKTLRCAYNQISYLNVSNLINLQTLECFHNQISNLNVSSLTILQTLKCSNNLISNLNVSSLTNLQTLDCSYNQLTTLLMKNGSIEDSGNLNLYSNPNLQYVCADDAQIVDVQNLISLYGYTNCHVNSYCSFTPGGIFYTVQVTNYFDIDNNGCNANDSLIPNIKLNFSNGTINGSFFGDTTGNYSIPVSAGTHTFTPVIENPSYFNVSPTTATVTFPTTASPFVQNFCVTANGVHPDLEVMLVPLIGARPGFDAVYKLVYKNKGNQTQSGSVNLTFNDAVLDLVSANPAVSTQVLNALSWDFSNLHPFETREIVFTLNVNAPTETPAVTAGYVLNYTTSVSSSATETTPSDNTFAYNQTVVNAFDPNEKVCLEGNTIAPAKVGDYVHYIIRFENDGTANAQNIVVKDMIDTTKFDITTLIPESGSATYTTRITNTNQVEFVFQNINLPFTAGTNTGYVAFKIKTKPTLVLGNTFSNTASIYFDYNFPIITNTATTTIQALANQDFEFSNYFTLYPNPAKNELNISTKSTIEVHSLTIYNLLGQVVLAIPNAQNLNTVDVSSLKTGNYFLKVTSDKGSATEKFMKE